MLSAGIGIARRCQSGARKCQMAQSARIDSAASLGLRRSRGGGEAVAGRRLESWISMASDDTEQALEQVRFLTVAEVAQIMRVSKMTVYRLVHAGDLPAVRVGRSFRVPEKAVHDYLRRSFTAAG